MLNKSNITNRHFWYGKEITEAEYNNILSMLRNIPVAAEGYRYRLTDNLEWELYELPQIEEEVS